MFRTYNENVRNDSENYPSYFHKQACRMMVAIIIIIIIGIIIIIRYCNIAVAYNIFETELFFLPNCLLCVS